MLMGVRGIALGNGRLTGKTALITGSARGVGAAIARAYAAAGAAVMVTDILDELGTETAREIAALGFGAAVYQTGRPRSSAASLSWARSTSSSATPSPTAPTTARSSST
jgi:NAD(P)-dependent dehydrogenase (short-subunit alcohol dehydrogenase family)